MEQDVIGTRVNTVTDVSRDITINGLAVGVE
jgi:hypothetical protein